MPNRPKRTPANPGRASIDIGGMVGAAGGGGVEGGPQVTPPVSSQVGAGVGALDSTAGANIKSVLDFANTQANGSPMTPTVNFSPYKATNPVMDALFNKGRNNAAATSANINYLDTTAQGINNMNNTLTVQGAGHQNTLQLNKINQDFTLKLNKIQQDDRLSLADKNAEIAKVAAEHAQNLGVLQNAGIVYSPENASTYDKALTDPLIKTRLANAGQDTSAAKLGEITNRAKFDGITQNYNDLVDTTGNAVKTGRVASEGALGLQPTLNSNAAFGASMQPQIMRAEAAKAPLIPVQSPLYNAVTRKTVINPEMDKMRAAMSGNLVPPLNGSSSGFPASSPASMNGLQANGDIILPDGTRVRPDGTRIPPNVTATE